MRIAVGSLIRICSHRLAKSSLSKLTAKPKPASHLLLLLPLLMLAAGTESRVVCALSVPPALEAALPAAAPGAVVALGYNAGAAPVSTLLNYNTTRLQPTGGAMIYSDDPETVSGFGSLYRDVLPAGINRVYTYHVNGNAALAKFPIVVKAGPAGATITFRRKALPAASGNYLLVGKTASQTFYTNASLPAPLTLAPNEAALLDPLLDSTNVSTNALLHGIYEFENSGPVEIGVCALTTSANTLAVWETLAVLPDDGNDRQTTVNTFSLENATTYTYDTTAEIKRLRVADNNALIDPAMPGFDAEDATSKALGGNFGISYRVRLDVRSSNAKNLAIILNPRGGAYAGYFRVLNTTLPKRPLAEGQMCPLSGTVSVNTDGVLIAKLTPTANFEPVTLEFIPAGASSMPIELHLVPYTGAVAPIGFSSILFD